MASFTNFSLTTDFPTTLSPNNTASKLTNNISPEVMQRELIVFILTTIFVSFGMIGIGATVDYKVVLKYLKKPHAYALGVFIQLACVPPLAWALTKIFQMPRAEALGVMIQGSCPGGTISNLVVFWTGGVIDLSVAMTATTTLLSLGTMPMWLFIFSKVEELPVNLLVPFDKLDMCRHPDAFYHYICDSYQYSAENTLDIYVEANCGCLSYANTGIWHWVSASTSALSGG
ncbi:sodium-dependent organic anion transporter-like isoform X2 [Clavelina lepadiformis]|uniref:sodium-dependent organic anion transporter-like isoform X2 n=1 Tax=Clavelina lepadiformis TaxID=159417 RepID=UPI0040435B93